MLLMISRINMTIRLFTVGARGLLIFSHRERSLLPLVISLLHDRPIKVEDGSLLLEYIKMSRGM
jgi:hypothetical protein